MPGGRKPKSQRGGYQAPATPAAVSTPGATSSRTDGGPSNPRLDLTGFDAERMGQRQSLESVASMTGGGGQPAPPPAPGQAIPVTGQGQSPVSLPDVFGPSDQPLVPATGPSPDYLAGAASLPQDHDAMLRALWVKYRHPDILRLLEMRKGE